MEKSRGGDEDGVERVEFEASEDGSGDAGGSWNSSGRSASGTARVRVMKKYALLFSSRKGHALYLKNKSGDQYTKDSV